MATDPPQGTDCKRLRYQTSPAVLRALAVASGSVPASAVTPVGGDGMARLQAEEQGGGTGRQAIGCRSLTVTRARSLILGVRGRDAAAVPARRDPRHHPPLHRVRRRSLRRLHGARRRGPCRRHLPRARGGARQGDNRRSGSGRAHGARHRVLWWACRVDERDRPLPWPAWVLRDRWRNDGLRDRRRLGDARARPSQRRLLRRRLFQPRLLPRVPELCRGYASAGRVRLREQPLRRVHPDGPGDRGRRHRGARIRPTGSPRKRSTATICGQC